MAFANPAAACANRRCSVPRQMLIAVLAIGSGALAQAHSPADPAKVSAGHPTGHTQDHADQTWPPQPRGITNVVSRADSSGQLRAAKAREAVTASLERVAMLRGDVRQALGNRYARTGLLERVGKDGIPANPVLVYFSHATNSTVEVTLDGRRVRSLRSIPPAEYQPEITDQEVAEAEGIARAHFAGLGEERVAELEAFGILAYRPTGSGFYDTRVIYISFHPDNDSFPEFAAWVDLTERRVLRILKENP